MSDKVMTAAAAVERFVAAGCHLAVGGMHMHNNPMALVRALVRQGRRIGRLYTSPSACLNADLLIGAGLVEEILTSYVGFEHLGLAPHFRRAVETGEVRLLECDEGFLMYGYQAGAGGLPFIPRPTGMDHTDIPRVNPAMYRTTTDPYTGATVTCVPPLQPDVALVHCAEADAAGNAAFLGAHFTDRIMALAARRVIIQCERLVSPEQMRRHPQGTTLPGFLAAAVVVAPRGCLPTSSHGEYPHDEAALQAYLAAARSPESFRAWLEQEVYRA